MFFQIDFANPLAIYDQVVRQIKFAVAGGVLKEGELVPSVRELARELTINPNTVARAYRQLQDDGVLTSVRGTGLAVAAGAAQRCREERVELIRVRLEQVFAEARQSRIDPRSCGRWWRQAIGRQSKTEGEIIMAPSSGSTNSASDSARKRRWTRSRSKCRPAWSLPCWAKTARARPPPSASCWDWPSRPPARPKCWAIAARPKG